jgi:transposase-like protein
VTYPRISGGKGSQAPPAYRALRAYDLMAEEVQAKLVRGVSTRDFQDVAGQIAEGTGLGKSTVSRAFVRASARSLAQINGRDLSKEQFVAVFIDGIGFGDALVVAALGVTLEGEKRVLGLIEGHTENATVVASLLDNLVDRGLALTEKFLAVIDGGKALRAALVRRWQGRVVIARCQVHKKRNVLEHLPPSHQAEVGRRMSVAYGMRDHDEALKFLQKTVEHLRLINEDAARSLEEGLEETLTVVKLALPEPLRRTFSTTNAIESVFDGVRYRTGRVKRWRNGKGQMVMRWTAAAALETEKRFHKVKGHKLLHLLASALKGNQVDMVEKVG